MAELTCRACGHTNPPGVVLCVACFSDLVPEDPAPPTTTRQAAAREETACPDCGAPLSAGGTCLVCRVGLDMGDTDPGPGRAPAAGPTSTRREAVGLVLDIAGRPVPVAGSVLLGRGQESPAADVLARWDNISRRHVTVRVDSDGTAWVRDEYSANGTFVSGQRIAEGRDQLLRPGDTLRLASDVEVGLRWGTR